MFKYGTTKGKYKLHLRILSLILSILLVVSTLFISNVAAVEKDQTERTVFLLLDCSGSMSGKPFSEMKKSAINLCNSLIEKSEKTEVALVCYSDKVELLERTSDLSVLTKKINEVKAYKKSDLYSALNSTKDYVNSLSDCDNKTIILMSDGLPSAGNNEITSEPKFLSTDKLDMSYANSVYELVKSDFNDYKIMTMGFYHSIKDESISESAQSFMESIQNIGYYNIEDGDKLFYTFQSAVEDIYEDFTADINSNSDDIPIIVVPGILGSKLYKDKHCTSIVWEPISWPIPQISDVFGSTDLYVKELTSNGEYGALDTYKTMMEYLKSKMPNREIYFFSYDFRKNNEYTAKLLADVIDKKGWEKVDILAHSMGGIVTSFYALENADKINHVVTYATPYDGAAELLKCVITDVLVGIPAVDSALLLLGLTTGVKRTISSLNELSPTSSYFNYIQDNASISEAFSFVNSNRKLSYQEYIDMKKILFGEKRYKESYNSINKLFDDDGVSKLSKLKNSYYVIGTGIPTCMSIVFGIDPDSGSYYTMEGLYTCDGDGTVPMLSATNLFRLTSPEYEGRVFYSSSEVYGQDKAAHTGITDNLVANDWVIDILTKGYSNIKSPDMTEINGYIIIRLDSDVDITVTDENNNVLSSKESITSSPFGRIDFYGKNNEIKYVILEDKDYDIKIEDDEKVTFNYSVTKYDNKDNLVEESAYTNLEIDKDDEIVSTIKQNEKLSPLVKNNKELKSGSYKKVNTKPITELENAFDVENSFIKNPAVNQIALYITLGAAGIILLIMLVVILNKKIQNNKI